MASNILPLFWNLASPSKDARLEASVELISTLEGFEAATTAEDSGSDSESEDELTNAEDVVYTVKRLVRGLASSRESSRFGFSVALTELLQRVDISPAKTLALIFKYSETSKSMKGTDERDGLFARLFGLTALVQSGALQRGSLKEFEAVIDALVELGGRKNYLRESAWWAINQVDVGDVAWREQALDKLATLQGSSPEHLALALRLEPYRDAGIRRPILSSQNLSTLARILRQDDDTWKPQLHFVWAPIFDALLDQPGHVAFQDFFRAVVDESLLANNASPQRRYWGFQVFITALPRVSPEVLPQLFTPNFMRCWMNNLSSSDRYLHKAAQNAAATVQQVVKANPNVGVALLGQLIGKHGRVDFDKATKTKTVEGVLANLSAEGVAEYVVYLKKLGDKWAVDQLSSLVRNQKVPRGAWIADVLDYLLVNGLFKDSPNTRERFFAALLDVSTATPPRTEERREQGRDDQGQLWLRRALDTVLRLEKTQRPVVDVDEIRSARKQSLAVLKQINGEPEMAKGCEMLLAYAILQTYDDKEDMLEILEDVTTAVQQVYGEKGDVEPVDLLLDTLIALLDKGSAGLRSLANMVLGLIAPALTASSVEHLVAQIEAAPQPIEGPEIDAEELESESDDESVSDASEPEEDMPEVDPDFRKRVEEALGMESDDESEVESVWDDDQMEKVDEQLAKVFKDRKEGTGKVQAKKMLTENVHFKTRILDLFDTYIRKQPANPLVLELVLPLLHLVRLSGDEATLASRAVNVIRRFDKPKDVPEADAKAILAEVHNFARRVNTNEASSAASICSLFLSRCSPAAATDEYRTTITDWMTRNNSHVRIPFITDYIKRFPIVAWPLRDELLKYLAQGEGYHPYRQTQVYSIIAIYCSYLSTIAASVPPPEIEAFVRDARTHVYETLRHAASGEGSTWKANWLKEVVKFALHLARVAKGTMGREGAMAVWDMEELEGVTEGVLQGQTKEMKGVHSLLKQLRTVIEAEAKKRKA